MDWKEFFKPTLPKIIISIIYFGLFILQFVFAFGCAWDNVGFLCETILPISKYLFLPNYGFALFFEYIFGPTPHYLIIHALFNLIFMYLLVSTIIFVVKLIKEKRNK